MRQLWRKSLIVEHVGLEPFQDVNGTKSDTIKKDCSDLAISGLTYRAYLTC